MYIYIYIYILIEAQLAIAPQTHKQYDAYSSLVRTIKIGLKILFRSYII